MKRLFYILIFCLIPLFVFANQRLVNLPLTSDLVDSEGNATSGSLSRVSAATYIDTSGVLQTAYGNRENLIIYSEDTSNWTGSGPWTQTVAVTENTSYVLSTFLDGATITTADDTATTDGPASATYGNEDTFTCSASGDITITTDTANPKAQLEALPSGNVIGPNLFDQDGGADSDEDKGAFTVKEYDTELVLNGDFEDWTAGDADNWTEFEGGDCSVTEETSIVNGGSSSAKLVVGASCHGNTEQTFSVDANTKYRICFSEYSSGTLKTLIQDSANDELNWSTTLWGGYVEGSFVGTTSWNEHCIETTTNNGVNDISIKFFNTNSNETYYIDDVSVKKVLSAGLLNAELVTNGDMSVDSMDNEGTGWSYDGTNDEWDCDGSQVADSDLTQNSVVSASGLYKCTFDVANYSAGSVTCLVDTAEGTDVSANGSYEQYIYADSAGIGGFRADSSFVGSVDNLSIKEVDISWTPYGTNTIEIDEDVGSGGALLTTYSNTDSGASLALSNAADFDSDLTVGESYLVTFDAKVGSGDSVDIEIAESDDTQLASVTTTATSFTSYELAFVASHATTDKIQFDNMGAGEEIWIDNITIKSIPDLALLEPSTYTATSGSTESIPAQARFETEGLLLEGEATNLILYSQDFSTWTAGGVTVTDNTTVAPDGTTTAATAADDNAYAWMAAEITSAVTSGETYTVSLWVKADSNVTSLLKPQDTAGSDFSECVISVTTEWQRFDCSHTFSASFSAWRLTFFPSLWGSGPNTVYIWGGQAEKSAFATSYIPTDSSPVTRTSEAGDGTYGVSFTISSAIQTALANNGTLLYTLTPQHAVADGSGTGSGLVTFEESVTGFTYYDYTNTDFEATDSTNTVTVDESLGDGTEYRIATRWHKNNDDLVISKKESGTWTHGTAGAFDDSIPHATNKLWLHYGNEYPAHYKNLAIYDWYVQDSLLDTPMTGGSMTMDMEMGM